RVGAEIEASAYLVHCGRLLADDNFCAPSFQRQLCGKSAHAAANDGNAWRARHPSPSICGCLTRDSVNGAHHSITSSARASSVGGISTPSVLAVLTLMINSSLVGNSMGKSATEVTSARTRQYRAQSQPRDARWPVSPRSRPTAQRPHRLVEGAAQVLSILDKQALAAAALHY